MPLLSRAPDGADGWARRHNTFGVPSSGARPVEHEQATAWWQAADELLSGGSIVIPEFAINRPAVASVWVGDGAGNLTSTGLRNSALGANALYAVTTGRDNAVLGANAAVALTTGVENFIGGPYAVAGGNPSYSVAIGMRALVNGTGESNVAIGWQAMQSATTANNNSATGLSALQSITTGANNVANGSGAGVGITTGSQHTLAGSAAGALLTTASNATAYGYRAMANASVAATAIGHESLISLTSGVDNVAVGPSAGAAIITGPGNTFVGARAGSGGDQIGTVSNSIAIGKDAYTSGNNEVVLGNLDVMTLKLGPARLAFMNNANNNLFLGDSGSTGYGVDIHGNLMIGENVFKSVTDVCTGNVGIGWEAMRDADNIADSVAVGALAMRNTTQTTGSVAIGRSAMEGNTTGTNVTAVGDSVLGSNQTSSGHTVSGYTSGFAHTTGDYNTVYGSYAYRFGTTGANLCLFGNGSGNTLNNCSNVVGVGVRSAYALAGAADSTFIGHKAGDHGSQKLDAQNSTAIGANSFTTADNQIVLGSSAVTELRTQARTIIRAPLKTAAAINVLGTNGSTGAGYQCITGTSSNTDASAKGFVFSVAPYTNANNPVVGVCMYAAVSTSEMYYGGGGWGQPDMTHHKFYSGTHTPASNDTSTLAFQITPTTIQFSRNFYPSADNTYSVGISANKPSVIYSNTGTINTSDGRLKTDIEDSPLGLDFIRALRPVRYKWVVGGHDIVQQDAPNPIDPDGGPIKIDVAVPKAGTRIHYGLIAQEVKAVLDGANVGDFAGWSIADRSDPESEQGLRYEQFIAPLIRAVQELSERVETLEAA